MKILFLTRFDKQGASSRLRIIQFLPWFESAGINCTLSPFFDDFMLLTKYKDSNYRLQQVLSAYWRRIHIVLKAKQFDLIWIEKEALPWFPAWIEKWLLRSVPYCLDFDDAIFHNYDLHRCSLIRHIYSHRIDTLMEGAHLVTAGNRYLGMRAVEAGANWVEIVPTVIDLMRYKTKKIYETTVKPRIVWIGSPSTSVYLKEIEEPLRKLSELKPFTLRVIGAEMFTMQGVDIEFIAWSVDKEAALIAECDIGIMPLIDSPWEQGKCAYKLIQYMACGLPTVASPVGANSDVVVNGKTGFFADTSVEWIEKLELLLCDIELRQRLGQAGRERVEAEYCIQQIAPKLIEFLSKKSLACVE